MGLEAWIFTSEELDEVFPKSPLREVAFEVRFLPSLRVTSELWRLQVQLAKTYPDVRRETILHPDAATVVQTIDVTAFQNPQECRVIKVSHQNFLIVFTRYVRFEVFKAEVLSQIERFSSTFNIDAFTRIGLRYVNEIILPSAEPAALVRYLRPIVSFDSFSLDQVDQFAAEVRARYRQHSVTLRSALLPGPPRTYVLDIDCHISILKEIREYPALLDEFHDSAQRLFLRHITDEYKQIMRREK